MKKKTKKTSKADLIELTNQKGVVTALQLNQLFLPKGKMNAFCVPPFGEAISKATVSVSQKVLVKVGKGCGIICAIAIIIVGKLYKPLNDNRSFLVKVPYLPHEVVISQMQSFNSLWTVRNLKS